MKVSSSYLFGLWKEKLEYQFLEEGGVRSPGIKNVGHTSLLF